MNNKVETLDRSFKENIQIEYPKDLTEIINLINNNKKISLIGSGLSFVPNFASKETISICLKKNVIASLLISKYSSWGIKFLSIQKGDMHKTFASTKKIKKLLNYKTKVNLDEGIKRFVLWYKNYYYN